MCIIAGVVLINISCSRLTFILFLAPFIVIRTGPTTQTPGFIETHQEVLVSNIKNYESHGQTLLQVFM